MHSLCGLLHVIMALVYQTSKRGPGCDFGKQNESSQKLRLVVVLCSSVYFRDLRLAKAISSKILFEHRKAHTEEQNIAETLWKKLSRSFIF